MVRSYLDAGNGRDGLGRGKVGSRQPSLAKSRNRDGPPHLFRRRVEFVFDGDLELLLTRLGRNVTH